MSEESHRVLDMLAQGKITVAEAEQLLQALKDDGPAPAAEPAEPAAKPKFLHVHVEQVQGTGRSHGPVNIRVPLGFIRSGMKLAALMPDSVRGQVNERLRQKGIDFDMAKMKPEDLESLFSQLSVDIDSDKEKVRIFCD